MNVFQCSPSAQMQSQCGYYTQTRNILGAYLWCDFSIHLDCCHPSNL